MSLLLIRSLTKQARLNVNLIRNAAAYRQYAEQKSQSSSSITKSSGKSEIGEVRNNKFHYITVNY
jgi:hypothetical protein